jgi:hypothetical protein
MSYISSFLASCFSTISSEVSFRASMMKSKSSVVSTVFILVTMAFDFFREKGYGRENFLFFRGSTSSLGGVTSPRLCSGPFPFISSTSSSPPQSGDTKAIFPEELLKSWTSLVFFIFLCLRVSCSLCMVSGLSGSEIFVGLNEEVCRPMLSDLLQVLFREFVV